MDKDLKRIITETVNQFFDKEPEKMIEQGIRNEYYDDELSEHKLALKWRKKK